MWGLHECTRCRKEVHEYTDVVTTSVRKLRRGDFQHDNDPKNHKKLLLKKKNCVLTKRLESSITKRNKSVTTRTGRQRKYLNNQSSITLMRHVLTFVAVGC